MNLRLKLYVFLYVFKDKTAVLSHPEAVLSQFWHESYEYLQNNQTLWWVYFQKGKEMVLSEMIYVKNGVILMSHVSMMLFKKPFLKIPLPVLRLHALPQAYNPSHLQPNIIG